MLPGPGVLLSSDKGKGFCPKPQSRVLFPGLLKYLLPFLLLVSGALFLSSSYLDSPRILSSSNLFIRSSSKKGSFALERWIKPPSRLIHNMSDEELFWAASFAPKVSKYPFNRIPKVAFMFLTKGPLPLFPLWEEFFRGNQGLYSIFLHSLPGYIADFPSGSVFYQRQVPSQAAEWGQISMIDAERRLLANALLDQSNEWFVLLSESCIPLRKFSTIYAYLKNSSHSFVECFDDPGPHGRGRYNPEMSPLVDADHWRKGSQWFEVDRKIAIHIVKDKMYYSAFSEFCRPPCYLDEHYIPTMLHIEKPSQIARRSVTFTDWSRGGAHPATFGEGDVSEEFLRRIRGEQDCLYSDQACVHFARKFAPNALKPLLGLAPAVLGF